MMRVLRAPELMKEIICPWQGRSTNPNHIVWKLGKPSFTCPGQGQGSGTDPLGPIQSGLAVKAIGFVEIRCNMLAQVIKLAVIKCSDQAQACSDQVQ